MGAKGRLKKQFRLSVDYLALQHSNAPDFYLSCWQWNRSALPLLCVRLVLFLCSLGILIFSLILTANRDVIGYWAIYMTQWALVMIVVTTGLATVVSAVAYFKGPIESSFGLPWYVKLYWVTYCIALPLSFHVTIFYYSLLTDAAPDDFEVNPVLDVLIHGVNSVLTFCLMITSQHPIYFVQFVFPFGFLLIYMTFSIVYYYAGGTNPFGEHTIYPILDWANPGPTVGLVFMCIALILVCTLIAVLFTLLRDYLSRKWNSHDTFVLG